MSGPRPDYTRGERAAILVSCMLGFVLDLYDVLILPFLMTAIQGTFQVGLAKVAGLTSLTLIGSVIGGALFGWLGDRMGRRTALQATLGLFALAAIGSAVAPSFAILALMRLVGGVGLGGEWGAGMALFNEAWRADRRGLGSACIQGMAVIASSAASIVAIWALGRFGADRGWRVALLTGASPLVLMIFIRLFMPESRAWQAAHDAGPASGVADAGRRFGALLAPPLRRVTLTALVWLTAYMFTYYALVTFIPTLMLTTLHTPPPVVRDVAIVVAIAGGVSYLTMGALNDRFGRRYGALVPGLAWLGMVSLLIAAAGVAYPGRLLSWPFFWCFLLFGIGNSAIGVAGTWLSELYPLDIRATGISTVYMAGRGIGSLAPLAVPAVAALAGGRLAVGMMVALPAAILFLAATLALPETRRRGRPPVIIDRQGVAT